MQNCIITRTGLPPICFEGELIGRGTTQDNDSTRWTEAALFRTQGGEYVARVENVTQWQGEKNTTITHAQLFPTAADAIAFLRGDGEKLGKASQEAIEEAAKADPALAAAWVETVE